MIPVEKIITIQQARGIAAFFITVTFSLILLNLPKTHQYRQTLLIDAALRGHTGRMNLLLALGASADNPACQSDYCLTPLVTAAVAGHSDAVQLLLEYGADVNRKSNAGQTALTAAAYNGHTDIIKILISKGADLNSEYDGCTALGFAKLRGHFEVVTLLLNNGANRDGNCE